MKWRSQFSIHEKRAGKNIIVDPITHTSDDIYDDSDDNNDDDGYPAHSHHDKFPLWWDFVRDDDGGNLSVTKSHH